MFFKHLTLCGLLVFNCQAMLDAIASEFDTQRDTALAQLEGCVSSHRQLVTKMNDSYNTESALQQEEQLISVFMVGRGLEIPEEIAGYMAQVKAKREGLASWRIEALKVLEKSRRIISEDLKDALAMHIFLGRPLDPFRAQDSRQLQERHRLFENRLTAIEGKAWPSEENRLKLWKTTFEQAL